jgi:acetyltransferase
MNRTEPVGSPGASAPAAPAVPGEPAGDDARSAATLRFVLDTLRRIVPGLAVDSLDRALPLRDQVDLESIEWLNFFDALQDGLHVVIPPADYARLATLDALLAHLAARRDASHAPREAPAQAPERRLADGRTVTIRPIRADDARRIGRFLAATSAESLYGRFHQWVVAPTARLVHFLTAIDPDRCMAFVCTTRAAGDEAIVGEARYVASEPGVCELGVLVEDDWQGSGIAGLLMDALIRDARERSYRRMEGLVLAQNGAMLRFARALGFDARHLADDPRTVRICLDLRPGSSPAAAAAAGQR